jgi:hypothetical protein
MGESIKAMLQLFVVIGLGAAALTWNSLIPDDKKWPVRIGAITVVVVAFGLLRLLQCRADLAPDYLAQQAGNYFNRDGFCFAFIATPVDGIAYLDAYFQNQYERPCVGRIGVRQGQFTGPLNSTIATMTYEINCGPAAFGFARLAIPVPEELQGKELPFQVGASVHFPNGKGKRLRFKDGLFLRTNANFGNSFGTVLTIVGAAAGVGVWYTPATLKILLPPGVAEVVANDPPAIRTLWQLGDASLGLAISDLPRVSGANE